MLRLRVYRRDLDGTTTELRRSEFAGDDGTSDFTSPSAYPPCACARCTPAAGPDADD